VTGGRIDDLTSHQHETVDPKSPEVVRALWPKATKDPYFAEFGWVARDLGTKVNRTGHAWTASGGPRPDQPLTLTWDNGAGLTSKRTIAIDRNYCSRCATRCGTRQRPVNMLPYAPDQPHRARRRSAALHPDEGMIRGTRGSFALGQIQLDQTGSR